MTIRETTSAFGGSASGSAGPLFDTFISEGGYSLTARAMGSLALNSEEEHDAGIKLSWLNADNKYSPSEARGKDRSFSFEFIEGVKENRFEYFSDQGPLRLRIASSSMRGIGYSFAEISNDDQIFQPGGPSEETYSFDGNERSGIALSNTMGRELKFFPSGNPYVAIGAGFQQSIVADRMALGLEITTSFGADPVISRGRPDDETDAAQWISYTYARGHRLVMGIKSDELLAANLEPFQDGGKYEALLGGAQSDTDRGAQANLPLFQSAAAYMSGPGDSIAIPLNSGIPGAIAGTVIDGGLSAIQLGMSSEGARTSGIQGLFSAARIPLNAGAGRDYEDVTALSHMGALMLISTIGTAVGGDGGEIIARAAIGAMADTASSPFPLTKSSAESSYMYAPVTFSNDGSRGAFITHQTMGEGLAKPCFESYLISPSLTPANSANHFEQNDPYSDTAAPSSFGGAFGVELSNEYVRFTAMADAMGVYGGDHTSELGAIVGLDGRIPLGSSGVGLIAGVRGMVNVQSNAEIHPELMLEFGIEFSAN